MDLRFQGSSSQPGQGGVAAPRAKCGFNSPSGFSLEFSSFCDRAAHGLVVRRLGAHPSHLQHPRVRKNTVCALSFPEVDFLGLDKMELISAGSRELSCRALPYTKDTQTALSTLCIFRAFSSSPGTAVEWFGTWSWCWSSLQLQFIFIQAQMVAAILLDKAKWGCSTELFVMLGFRVAGVQELHRI